jgi:hypothetical protein
MCWPWSRVGLVLRRFAPLPVWPSFETRRPLRSALSPDDGEQSDAAPPMLEFEHAPLPGCVVVARFVLYG